MPTRKLVKQTTFVGDLLRLLSGTFAATAIGLLVAPILTRLYEPEAFGVLALFMSIVSIVGIVSCARYEVAIVLPSSDSEAANVLGISLFFLLVTTSLVVLGISFKDEQLFAEIGLSKLHECLWLLPGAVFLHGLYLTLNYWKTRTKYFTRISVSQVSNQFVTAVSKLGLGISGLATGHSMVVATLLGRLIGVLVLLFMMLRDHGRFIMRSLHPAKMFEAAKRYKRFPLYGSWSILLGVGAWQVPILLIGFFFSPAIAGLYSFGFRILQLPMNTVGSAIGQVFYPQAMEAREQGRLDSLVERMLNILIVLALFPMLTLSIVGQELYMVVFGEKWAEAGMYCQILAPWAFFWFLSGPFTNIFSVMEEQKIQLIWNIINFFSRVISILIGVYLQNFFVSIALLGASGTLIYLAKTLITVHLAGCSIKQALAIIVRNIVYFVPFGILLTLLVLDQRSPVLTVAVAIAFCCLHALRVFYQYHPEIIALIRDRQSKK